MKNKTKGVPVTKVSKKTMWKTKDGEVNIHNPEEVNNVYLQNIYGIVMQREYLAQEQISQARLNLASNLFLTKEILEEAKNRGIELKPIYKHAGMVKYFHAKEELQNSNEL